MFLGGFDLKNNFIFFQDALEKEAIQKSILHWQDIEKKLLLYLGKNFKIQKSNKKNNSISIIQLSDNIKIDYSGSSCPLCALCSDCSDCPVYKKTGFPYCVNTPWLNFNEEILRSIKNNCLIVTDKMVLHAREMIRFLKGLFNVS